MGKSKNKKTPEARCKIETIAGIGKRIVSKFKFFGRLLFITVQRHPFNLNQTAGLYSAH